MKSLAYIIAVMASIGIMMSIVTYYEVSSDAEPNQTTQQASSATPAKTSRVMAEDGKLTLDVPDMHCAVMCYPKIKKTLESDQNVAVVELADQKEEGMIDNPQVIVTYKAGFDLDAAIADLGKNGYENSKLVENTGS